MPGFTRRRRGKGFSYLDCKGQSLTDARDRERIRALAIPPAWTSVWICPIANGHLQATGRDDRGRKQYLYHPRWSEVSNRAKFDRMFLFGERLSRMRRQLAKDLSRRKLDRRKVLATVVHLLDTTLIRVGNREYAAENNSRGLTTLRERHVSVNGSDIQFRFHGKSGRKHRISLHDRRLARILLQCEELPGQALFQYQDGDGEFVPIESDDVNRYLGEIGGEAFTAKDFRTWRGSAIAIGQLTDAAQEGAKATKRRVNEAIAATAEALGNTKTICRNYYVHPDITDRYLSGALAACWETFSPSRRSRLDADEQFLLCLLREMSSAKASGL